MAGEETVLQTADVRVRVMTLAAGAEVGWHCHSRVTDHLVCLEGRVAVECREPGESHLLAPGERCGIVAGRPHRVRNAGAGTARYLLIQGVGEYDFITVTPAAPGS